MNDHGKGIIAAPDPTPEQIRQAWEYAAMQAMLVHRDHDVPVTIWDWENGRVLQVPASRFLDQQAAQENPQPAPAGDMNQDTTRKSA